AAIVRDLQLAQQAYFNSLFPQRPASRSDYPTLLSGEPQRRKETSHAAANDRSNAPASTWQR
ncbi:MAG TPA: hypothetical protein VNO55_25610, partial [Polyangia bacterium]|nr:hypothetical protein [Polyangia bacterium]